MATKTKATKPITPAAPPVEYREPAPNEMFSPELTALLRFFRNRAGFTCACCGKKKSKSTFGWTMLCPFKASDSMNSHLPTFVITFKEPAFEPLTPCCADCLLAPRDDIQLAMNGGWTHDELRALHEAKRKEKSTDATD